MKPGTTSQTGGQTGQVGITGQVGLTGQANLTGQAGGAVNANITVVQPGVSGQSGTGVGTVSTAGQFQAIITNIYVYAPAGYDPRIYSRQKLFLDPRGFAKTSK